MPAEQTSAAEAELPGLPESIRLWLASAAGYLHARLALLGLEAKDAAVSYLQIALLLIAAVILVIFGYVFLVIAAAFLVAYLFQWPWGWITLAFGLAHVFLAAACVFIAKSRFSGAGFASSIAEFKKDQEWLNQKNRQSQTHAAARMN